jgi:hypothetical protein
MKRSVYHISILLVCLMLSAGSLYAQSESDAEITDSQGISYRYDTGDTMFTFDAGPYLPLFVLLPEGDTFYNAITDNTYLGGNASMGFEAFLNRRVSLGFELGFTFSYAKDDTLYTAVPFLGNLSYYALQGDIDIPLTLGVGVIYNSYGKQSYLSPFFLKPEIGVIWNFNDNWGLGVDTSYWFVPEIYTGDNSHKTALYNAVSAKLSLQYRQ